MLLDPFSQAAATFSHCFQARLPLYQVPWRAEAEGGKVVRQHWEVSPMCGNIAVVLLFSKSFYKKSV